MAIDVGKLLALPAAERLELADMLWKSVGYPANIEAFPMPAWQQAELDRLLDEYDAAGDDDLTAEAVRAETRREKCPGA